MIDPQLNMCIPEGLKGAVRGIYLRGLWKIIRFDPKTIWCKGELSDRCINRTLGIEVGNSSIKITGDTFLFLGSFKLFHCHDMSIFSPRGFISAQEDTDAAGDTC